MCYGFGMGAHGVLRLGLIVLCSKLKTKLSFKGGNITLLVSAIYLNCKFVRLEASGG